MKQRFFASQQMKSEAQTLIYCALIGENTGPFKQDPPNSMLNFCLFPSSILQHFLPEA